MKQEINPAKQEIKTLEDFVQALSENSGYEVTNDNLLLSKPKKDDKSVIGMLLPERIHAFNLKSTLDDYLLLTKNEERTVVLLHKRIIFPKKVDIILEAEKELASHGVYIAHIFQVGNYKVGRYVLGIKPSESVMPLVLSRFETEISSRQHNLMAYFSPENQSLGIYHVKNGVARRIYEIAELYKITEKDKSGATLNKFEVKGELYFPHANQNFGAVAYHTPSIERSAEVIDFPKRLSISQDKEAIGADVSKLAKS